MSDWIWKAAAIIGGICTLGIGGLLYYICREVSDGFADAFGYPKPKRWRRQ